MVNKKLLEINFWVQCLCMWEYLVGYIWQRYVSEKIARFTVLQLRASWSCDVCIRFSYINWHRFENIDCHDLKLRWNVFDGLHGWWKPTTFARVALNKRTRFTHECECIRITDIITSNAFSHLISFKWRLEWELFKLFINIQEALLEWASS